MFCLVVYMGLVVILGRIFAFRSQRDYKPDEKRKSDNAGKEYSSKVEILFFLYL